MIFNSKCRNCPFFRAFLLRNEGKRWEGGIRPAAFVHSALLPTAAVGRWYDGIVHETDWSATVLGLVARHGGLSATHGLNYTLVGVDAWPALVSASAPHTRTEVLLGHNIMRRENYKVGCFLFFCDFQ